MEETGFKVGDTVKHLFIGQGTDLFVIAIEGNKLTARYHKDGVFYTNEFYTFEVEPHKRSKLNFAALSGVR